jgi:hypothetical protein
VTGGFALTGGSKIVPSGVPPGAILYNIIGTGSAVGLIGGASIDSTILAVEPDIALTPSLVNGEAHRGAEHQHNRQCQRDLSVVSGAVKRGKAAPILRRRGSRR